jgi:hypothetical protein
VPLLDEAGTRVCEAFRVDARFALQERLDSLEHLLLGHPAYIQDNPHEEITFFGAPEDIRAGHWDRLHAQVDSS